MMDNSNPGSRDLVVLPTGLAHTVVYAYKYTVAVVAARACRYTQHIVSHTDTHSTLSVTHYTSCH